MPDNYWNGRHRGRRRFPKDIEVTYVVPAIELDPITEVKRLIRDRMRPQSLQTGATWPLADTVVPTVEIPIGEL